ncbi:hypothetical protein MMC07_003758 [Pseudocyphellaria aurata]|nr:hypothetical protein [Pseudocyphellaria aurata]
MESHSGLSSVSKSLTTINFCADKGHAHVVLRYRWRTMPRPRTGHMTNLVKPIIMRSGVQGDGSTNGQEIQSTDASVPVFQCAAVLTCVSTPRTPYVDHPVEQHPQTRDPAGPQSSAPGHHGHASSTPTGDAAITQAFQRLNVRGSQPSQGIVHRSGQSSLSQPRDATVPSMSEHSGQRGPSYYSHRSPTAVVEPNRSFRLAGHSSAQPNHHVSHQGENQGRNSTSVQGVGRTAGKLPAQGYQTQWPPANSYMGAYDANQMAQVQHASHVSHQGESRGGGSSHSAHPSNTSYPAHQPGLGENQAAVFRSDRLNPKEFKQITHKRKRFFVVGKVFMMLYIENAGETADRASQGGTNFTTVAHGEVAHHQFRRFVVVKEMSEQNFCYCCPITTYGNRATTKPGVDQSSHTIVYSGRTAPEKLSGETNMNKDPLRISLCTPDDKLDPRSRINLGREYSIDHNVKVKYIGDVDERSLPKLIQYRKAVRDG